MFAALLPLLLAFPAALALPCVEFDTNFNLYAFGLNGKDVNLGAQSTWLSPNPQAIATSGRPPFDGTNTQCFLSQYNNAIYVLDGDNANPANVYIYDATGNAWSTSTITAAGVDPSSLVAILDHDTNVFFALSGGSLYQLDFSEVKTTSLGASSWEAIEAPSFTTTNYEPVMAIAQNHIFFLDVPGNTAGEADIFVIHFAYFQPEVQSFPGTSGSATFPEQHGQVTSFFDPNNNVQQQFAFIPDDMSATYIVNVETNTTISLSSPLETTASTFAASDAALVQLTSAGQIFYTPFDQTNPGATLQWAQIPGFPSAGAANASTAAAGTATGTQSSTGTPTALAPGTKSAAGTAAPSSSSTAASHSGAWKMPGVDGALWAVALMALAGCALL